MQAVRSDSTPRIAIIGGGPGGLTLARILQTRSIDAKVFELEESPRVRPQGGTLDLHAESGQLALRLAGLEEEFRSIARYEDQGSRLYDKQGRLLLDESETDGDRPEVDRTALRKVLLESLPDQVVRWGCKLKEVLPRLDGTWQVVFENGESGVFDLVVGADGAWSRVRPLVSDCRPEYTGVTFYELGIDDVDLRHPDIARLVGRGKIFALGDSKALIAQRNGNGHFRVYAALRISEAASADALDLSSPDRAKARLDEIFHDWAPELRALIHKSGDWIARRPLYALPIGHCWKNRPGITLLGDAAHLMSPFGGEGVNLAMLDAADLALALAADGDWRAGVEAYEVKMCARAAESAAGAAEGVQRFLSENALSEALEQMQAHGGEPVPI